MILEVISIIASTLTLAVLIGRIIQEKKIKSSCMIINENDELAHELTKQMQMVKHMQHHHKHTTNLP